MRRALWGGGAKASQRAPEAAGPPWGLALRVVRAAISRQLVDFETGLTMRGTA